MITPPIVPLASLSAGGGDYAHKGEGTGLGFFFGFGASDFGFGFSRFVRISSLEFCAENIKRCPSVRL
jgi:hypothetical protein